MSEADPQFAHLRRQPACPMVLRGGPISSNAKALVEALLTDIIIPANPTVTKLRELKPPRPTSIDKMRMATGAVLSDLFDFHRGARKHTQPRRGFHGMSKGSFTIKDLGFGYDIFTQVIAPLVAAGLLEHTPGATGWTLVCGHWVPVDGNQTTFGLTPAILDLAAAQDITVDGWLQHWRRTDGRPSAIVEPSYLELRTAKARVGNHVQDPKPMAIDWTDPLPQAILAAIERINGHLAQQTIGGLVFPGLRRIFSNSDQADFRWNKGGRFYSLKGGHAYETWNSERRREAITINGEGVDEVDLRASHLTLLHGLLGCQFDAHRDPYDMAGWPRAVVKHWVSQAIGASNPRPIQWSQSAEDAFQDERPGQWIEHDFPIREVGAAVTERHPLLIDLRDCGVSTLDLQFHEAEILRAAMEELMFDHGITVLPMHDALIAPLSKAEAVQDVLQRAFVGHVEKVTGQFCQAIPRLTLKRTDKA